MKTIKRFVAGFLSICCLLTVMSVQITASSADAQLQDIPIITVPGTTNVALLDESGKRVMPDNIDAKDIIEDKEFVDRALKEYAKCALTHKWDTYCDMIYDRLAPIWAEQICDNNGDSQKNLHIAGGQELSRVPKKSSNFHEEDYIFRFDWRLDPFVIADELDAYIDGILEITGAQKVGLVSRCYGSCIVSAYLQKYAYKGKVDTTIYNCPTVKGIETLDAVFSGAIEFDADSIEVAGNYYLTQEKPIQDDDITLLLSSLITVLNYTGTLDLGVVAGQALVDSIKDNLLPRLLRASYGTMPGYWAMISDEAFEKSISFVFGGHEDEYAGLINRIRTYHNEVQVPLFDNLDTLKSEGMKLMLIAKYGTPTYPYFEGSSYQTDGSNSIYRMSFGATAPEVNKTLSPKYVEEMRSKGTDKYISPDLKIDASTCRYRDSTWFFKDVSHDELPAYISNFMTYCVQHVEQLTVWENEAYTQYMRRNSEGSFVPVEADDESDAKWNRLNFFEAIVSFFKALFEVMKVKFAEKTQLPSA